MGKTRDSSLPYSSKDCKQMRHKLLQAVYKHDEKDLGILLKRELGSYQHQGSAWGVLIVWSWVAFTYFKVPVMKPHFPGIFLGTSLGYFLGGWMGIETGAQFVLDKIGVIKEDAELEKRRQEVLSICKGL
jgi:hypothetical protein